MARTKKKVEPIKVKAGVEVAEVVVPVTVEAPTSNDAPKKPRATRKPAATSRKSPASNGTTAPKPAAAPADPRPSAAESSRRLEEFVGMADEFRAAFRSLAELREQAVREIEASRRQTTSGMTALVAELEQVKAGLRTASTQIGELGEQTKQSRAAFKELGQLREQVSREIETARQETAAGVIKITEGLEAARKDLKTATRQMQQTAEEFDSSRQSLLGELREQLEPLRQAQPQLQSLPSQAAELHQQLSKIAHELPEATRQCQELARQNCEARAQLDALRSQITAAELRLVVVEQQVREGEGRIQNAREQLQRVESEAQQPTVAEPSDESPRDLLGVTVGPGVVVSEVEIDSPAASAGLLPGDVIAAVNGVPVLSGLEVRDAVQAATGDSISLAVVREGQAMEVTPQLPAAVAEGEQNRLGLVVGNGVVVAEVTPGSAAEQAGLLTGDVIAAVDGTPVQTGTQVRQIVQLLIDRGTIHLEIDRAGQPREIVVGTESQSA